MSTNDQTSCPTHPQSSIWHHQDGDRCAICGRFDDGRDGPVAEPSTIRTFARYRELVERTDSPEGRFPIEYTAGCLCEEAGEFFGKVKKVVYHKHPLDEAMRANLRGELGDALWYLDRCAERLGMTLDEVAAANIRKLEIRYPNGFSFESSLNRVTSASQEVAQHDSVTCPSCKAYVYPTAVLKTGDVMACWSCANPMQVREVESNGRIVVRSYSP